jgi:hypothetical protein
MKLPCPACAQPLNLPDKFAGKNVKCPACQQSFDAPAAIGVNEWSQNVDAAVPDELALHSLIDKPDTSIPDPTNLEFCPGCSARWKKGARECKKCHYNAIAGAKLKPPNKHRGNIYFDWQKVFLYIAALGAAVGVYWVFNNFEYIKRKYESAFDLGPPAPVTSPLQPGKPKKPDRGD